jgi:hypothetical protein
MASATTALTALAPYAAPDGLGPREIIAHAKEHIERLTKKHASLQDTLTKVQGYGVSKLKTGMATGTTLAVSSALGFVNGRYGGERGYLSVFHVPVDLTTGLVAHVVGATDVLGDLGTRLVHTVGDACWGAGAYRWTHSKGAELAARAAAAKAAAGAGAGAGAAANPNGQRPGTTYAVPQK